MTSLNFSIKAFEKITSQLIQVIYLLFQPQFQNRVHQSIGMENKLAEVWVTSLEFSIRGFERHIAISIFFSKGNTYLIFIDLRLGFHLADFISQIHQDNIT